MTATVGIRQSRRVLDGFTPLWKTPSRAQAIGILQRCRGWTDSRVAPLTSEQRQTPTLLGDGSWSVKDLLGHLATHEHRALLIMGVRTASGDDLSSFDSVADFNDHHLRAKSSWSLDKVEQDYAATRDELVAAIEATDDARWLEKIPAGGGRSALALVLAKALNGDRYGYFAHDLAHARGLDAAIAQLSPPLA